MKMTKGRTEDHPELDSGISRADWMKEFLKLKVGECIIFDQSEDSPHERNRTRNTLRNGAYRISREGDDGCEFRTRSLDGHRWGVWRVK